MVESNPHPLVESEPGGLCWKRSDHRRPGRGPEAHQELVVLLGIGGLAKYLIDGQVYDIKRGTMVWTLSGQAHVLLSETPHFDMWVYLISDRVMPEAGQGSFPPLKRPKDSDFPPRRLSEVETLELDAIAQATKAELDPVACRTGLRWWLLRGWAHWKAARDNEGRHVHRAVDRAAQILRENPNLPLVELSQRVGLSPGRLGRLFRAQIGAGLVAYRSDQKLERADTLLRNQHITLTTAALDAGFGSYSQFFRAFCDRRGMSPREYYGMK